MSSSMTLGDVDLDAHTFDLSRLDIEIRCDIITIEGRELDQCTNVAKWVALMGPHCSATKPLTMMLCQEHLDWLMTGEMATWCRTCKAENVPMLPYVIRIEPL